MNVYFDRYRDKIPFHRRTEELETQYGEMLCFKNDGDKWFSVTRSFIDAQEAEKIWNRAHEYFKEEKLNAFS